MVIEAWNHGISEGFTMGSEPSDYTIFQKTIKIWVKFDHDRTLFSRSLESWFMLREIIPFYGRKIQVSDIL